MIETSDENTDRLCDSCGESLGNEYSYELLSGEEICANCYFVSKVLDGIT